MRALNDRNSRSSFSVHMPLSAAARRERALSGDGRAGRYPLSKARRAQWAFARRRWLVLVALAMTIVVPALVCVVFVPGDFARGLVLGAALAGAAGMVVMFVQQATGTAPTIMGGLAEQWTASELRPLRRHGWRLVNHLLLKHGDIDHVLVGPGGAYAFETRWSATPWRWDGTDPRIQRAAEDARRHANTLSHWHPFKSVGATSVQAVVVLWGAVDPNASGDATARSSDGVPVLHGLDGLRRWRAYLLGGAGRGALTEDQIDAVWNGIDDHARKRDEKELAQPAPPTMLCAVSAGMCADRGGTPRVPSQRATAVAAAQPVAMVRARAGPSAWRGHRGEEVQVKTRHPRVARRCRIVRAHRSGCPYVLRGHRSTHHSHLLTVRSSASLTSLRHVLVRRRPRRRSRPWRGYILPVR